MCGRRQVQGISGYYISNRGKEGNFKEGFCRRGVYKFYLKGQKRIDS